MAKELAIEVVVDGSEAELDELHDDEEVYHSVVAFPGGAVLLRLSAGWVGDESPAGVGQGEREWKDREVGVWMGRRRHARYVPLQSP